MKIEVIDSIEKLLAYKKEWESILKEIDSDNVFLELDWIMLWWKYFGDRHKLFVLVVVNNQEIIGICPLMATNKRIYKIIDFIGGRESSRMDFILRNEYRQEALEYICNFLRNLKGKSIISFHGIPEKSPNYTLIMKYFKANKVPYLSIYNTFYFIDLKASGFNTYFEGRFGKRSRQTMNKKERRLDSLGNLDYRKISPVEIDGVFEVHDKRWLRKIGNSSFSKSGTKEFYKGLIQNRSTRFKATVDVIKLNARIISFIYGLEYNGKSLLIRIAHDDDFYFFSPGELAWKKKIEECFLSQMRVVDFGPGYEPYKAKWTDDYEKLFTMLLPASNIQSLAILYIKYWSKIKLINALRNNRSIYNLMKHLLGRLKFLLSQEYISNEVLKIKRTVNQNGLLAFIKKSLSDLTNKIFSYKEYLILERKLSNVEISEGGLLVKEATIDDLDELSEVMNEAVSGIVRRFANKHKCYITLYKYEIIHYCWINCSSIKIAGIELDIPLQNIDVHIYDTFMKKKYKNENNYTYIFSNIFNFLYRQNFRKCYLTLNNNTSSENEILKKIFNPSHKILEKKVFRTIKHSIVDITSLH